MRLIAYILIHHFFLTCCRRLSALPDAASSLEAAPAAVINKSRVLDLSVPAADAGVRLGMSRHQALRTCPDLRLIDFNPRRSAEMGADATARCYELGPRVENLADNELFIDLSGQKPPSARIFHNLAEDLAPRFGTKLTIGLAENRLLAKAAGLAASPQGYQCSFPAVRKISPQSGLVIKRHQKFQLALVNSAGAAEFIPSLPVEMMWPFDDSIHKKMKNLGLNTFADIAEVPMTLLHNAFGSLAPIIADYSKGIDKSRVPAWRPPEQISYHENCDNPGRIGLEQSLKKAAVYLGHSLREQGKSYRRLELDLLTEDGLTYSHKINLSKGRYEMGLIFLDCLNLLDKAKPVRPIVEIVLTAANLTLHSHSQLAFFEDPAALNSQAYDHRQKLFRVCENLTAKYNAGIIMTGSKLPITRREQMLMFIDPFRREESGMKSDG